MRAIAPSTGRHMISLKLASRLSQLLSVRSDNQELRQAQFAALSRLIPMMYFILIVNA